MPFVKGHHKSPEAGMKKGQKSAKVQQWEALGELITNELTEEAIKYLRTLKPEDQFERYLDLLEYFKPKLSRAEIKQDIDLNAKDVIFNFRTLNEQGG
jgi:nicotinic acid phosphoribosyltransferase